MWAADNRQAVTMVKRKTDRTSTAAVSITRSTLNAGFIDALAKDWAENGAQVIAILRVSDPKTYSTLIASLAPKMIEVTDTGQDFQNMSEDELRAYIADNQPAPTEADLVRLFNRDPVLFSRVVAAVRDQADPIVQIIRDDAPEAA
jgi:hypothetical protein